MSRDPMIRVSEDGRPRSTKNIHFYKSGDQSFSGVKMPVNYRKYRTLDALLDDLSLKVPGLSYGVRRLATPSGKRQITALDQLEHLGNYVCSDKASARKVAGVDIAKLPGAGFDSQFRGNLISTPRPGEMVTFKSRSQSQPPSLTNTNSLSLPDYQVGGKSPPKRRRKSKSKSRSPRKRVGSEPVKLRAGIRKKSTSPEKKRTSKKLSK